MSKSTFAKLALLVAGCLLGGYMLGWDSHARMPKDVLNPAVRSFGALLSLPKEAGVLERDGRLGGEGRGDREILRGEALLPAGPDTQHPEHLLAEKERHP